jgi:hypothetical protein
MPSGSKPEYRKAEGSLTHPCPLNVFASAVAHAEDYVRHPAVGIEPSLRPQSPENGNISGAGRRLSAFFRPEALSGRMETGSRCVKACQRRAFLELHEMSSRKPDCLAGDAVLIAPVSGQIPCKQGILQGISQIPGL